MRNVPYFLLLAAIATWPLSAQTAPAWDNSGNAMLNGTYYFREVAYAVGDGYGDLSEAAALYNTIKFDGNGNYTGAALLMDSGSYTPTPVSIKGTYSISASGYGFISNPLVSGAVLYGLVSQQGIFIGSSTEADFNELFIAAPVASPAAGNATLKGSYAVADLDVTLALEQGDIGYVIGSNFTINPDGAGNLGNFNISGYLGGAGATIYTQANSAIKYAFSNGAASFTIPLTNNATLMGGQEYIYISPDGNFIFGGSPNAWDFFVGVRTGTGTPNLNGLYYQTGIDEDESSYQSAGYGLMDTYIGSLNATNGVILGHQRQNDVLLGATAVGFTYSDTYNVPASGAYTDPSGITKYVVGAGGAARIGWGLGPYLGLNVALAAPSLNAGTGVWIDPTRVVNAGSSAPFTAGVSPGELISIFGSKLAPGLQVAADVPFPTNLNGVQVTINNTPAPLYFVSSGQLAAIVPNEITGPIASISVNNNGTASNTVTSFVYQTTPGVLTQTADGIGNSVALHAADYSLVTAANPAKAGETVAVYVTGLGAVSPSVPDGAPGPVPAANTTNTMLADLNGTSATVGFAGLAPDLAGLYQINLTIPSGLTAGDNVLDIEGCVGTSASNCSADSYTSEAVIPVGSGSTTSVQTPAAVTSATLPRRLHPAGKPVLRRTNCMRLSSACAGRQ